METMTVKLKIETIDKLRLIGKSGESYDDIIQHLIDKVEYKAFMQEQYKILDEEKEWISLDEL
ncbi:MAG: hypothetical protein HF976_03140 [ANME-2 cluster archaeon]|nr:hypothetical protein [ANME-2 cluster archaeon]MBC2700398.1 hypothetical protein [ANME-2 cluster archaeon]MBC2706595.1 hypothetical protein [ANME-2 cluster archaeon]MBC2748037.1 hypothetical protein [ANME-2 cluster archaeon]MBC2762866.1 hypothetical protein [ANME-2 cluster archaeon]